MPDPCPSPWPPDAVPPPPRPDPPRVKHEPAHPIRTCASCRFRAPDGTCRRHAPQDADGAARWPAVARSDYCGKYEPPHPHDEHA